MRHLIKRVMVGLAAISIGLGAGANAAAAQDPAPDEVGSITHSDSAEADGSTSAAAAQDPAPDAGSATSFGPLSAEVGASGATAQASPAGVVAETVTHSESFEVVFNNSIACSPDAGATTFENSYFRVFDLASFDIDGDYTVTSVDVGVEEANVDTEVTLNLYTLRGDLQLSSLLPIGTSTQTIPAGTLTELVTIPVSGITAEASTLVVELSVPSLTDVDGKFFIGSNSAGQTGPSYIAAEECGAPDITDIADLTPDDVHIVMAVTGNVSPPVTETVTHSDSFEVVLQNSIACSPDAGATTFENSYFRVFDLASFGIDRDYAVTSVDVGVEEANVDTEVTLNLYQLDGDLQLSNLIPIGTSTQTIPSGTLTELVKIPVSGVTPEASTLVVEVSVPSLIDVGGKFFIGSNSAGQTGPSYIAAEDCGAPDITDIADLAPGDIHIVMAVTGNVLSPVTDDTPPVVVGSVSGDLGLAGWYVGDVDVSWAVSDDESEVTTDGCGAVTVDSDTAGVELTCTATSEGGTTVETVSVARDATAPEVAVTGVADGDTHIIGEVPPAGCDTTDATSGVATPAELTVTGGFSDGTGTFVATCDGASDAAGNAADPVTATYTVMHPPWDETVTYGAGDRVSFDGVTYEALRKTSNQVPGAVSGPWQEIAETEDGTAIWTASRVFDTGDIVFHEGNLYEAQRRTRNQPPGDPGAPWELIS